MSISFYALTATGDLVDHEAPGAAWSPNVANGNAAVVLEALGLPLGEDGDHYGEVSAEDFLGRVLLGLAVTPADPGVPATSREIGDGFGDAPVLTAGGRWHDMGRREGYLQDKLAELHQLALWATERGYTVAWA